MLAVAHRMPAQARHWRMDGLRGAEQQPSAAAALAQPLELEPPAAMVSPVVREPDCHFAGGPEPEDQC
jgi:hypothetical protein